MKLLVLSINFKGWVTETLYREQQAIAKIIPDTVFYGPGFTFNHNHLPDIIKEIYGTESPDAIICYISEHQFEQLPVPVIERFHIPKPLQIFPLDLNKVKVPKILWMNDFWHCTHAEWRKIIQENGFSAVFSTYYLPFTSKKTFDNFFDSDIQKQIPFYPLPRAIDQTLFKDYRLPKEFDVTLLGALDEDFYPLRTYFHRTLQKQEGIRYFNKNHPGYAYYNQKSNPDDLIGENYAQAINRSLIFLSCTGRYKIPFIKLYEVLASRTLLMCDRPMGAEKIGLVDGETYIQVDRVNFLEKIRYYLRRPDKIKRIADNGYHLFLKRHTTKIRATEFKELVEEVISQGYLAKCNFIFKSHLIGNFFSRRRLKHIASKVKDRLVTSSFSPSTVNPWPVPNTVSALDARVVKEDVHILDLGLKFNFADYKLFLNYGLNIDWDSFPPVLTQHPELVIYRGVYLRTLADRVSAKVLCEVGTARGWQSMIWANYLEEKGVKDGIVFTCDIKSHFISIYRTSLTGSVKWTRNELWAWNTASRRIQFVEGDSAVMAQQIDRPLDLVFIDGEHSKESVLADFTNLEKHFAQKCIVVFDDCDARFPGVEEAVSEIALNKKNNLEIVSFWPSYYKIAVLLVDER